MEIKTSMPRARIKGTTIYADAFVVGDGKGSPADQAPYHAARSGRRAIGLQAPAFGPNAALQFSLEPLRDRSRNQVRQNAYAAAVVDRVVSNVVGCGIKPQSSCPDPGLRAELQELWEDWTDEADADGVLDFYGLQMLAARAAVTDGEVFARFRQRRLGDVSTVPFQIQLLEADYVPNDYNHQAPNNNWIRSGIEFSRIGRRQAYWMYPQHPGDSLVVPMTDLQPRAIPAAEVMHVFLPNRAGVIRGEPRLARALIKLADLDAYDDAELVRKKTTAMLAGFITKPEAGGPSFGDDGDDDDDLVLEPGTMQELRPGEDIVWSDPKDVGGQYEPFMRQQLRAVATAGGVLYEQLTGDYSNLNDRTLRASLNEIRRQFAQVQHHMMVFQMCRPVWRRFVMQAEMAGLIRRPQGMTDRDLLRVRWIPEAWPYINPVQDVQARREEVRAGFASRSEMVSERGYDSEEIDREIAEDNARADGLGVVYDSDARQTSRSGGTNGGGQTQARSEGTEIPDMTSEEEANEDAR